MGNTLINENNLNLKFNNLLANSLVISSFESDFSFTDLKLINAISCFIFTVLYFGFFYSVLNSEFSFNTSSFGFCFFICIMFYIFVSFIFDLMFSFFKFVATLPFFIYFHSLNKKFKSDVLSFSEDEMLYLYEFHEKSNVNSNDFNSRVALLTLICKPYLKYPLSSIDRNFNSNFLIENS